MPFTSDHRSFWDLFETLLVVMCTWICVGLKITCSRIPDYLKCHTFHHAKDESHQEQLSYPVGESKKRTSKEAFPLPRQRATILKSNQQTEGQFLSCHCIKCCTFWDRTMVITGRSEESPAFESKRGRGCQKEEICKNLLIVQKLSEVVSQPTAQCTNTTRYPFLN